MTWIAEAQRTNRVKYHAFRGEFTDLAGAATASVAWSDAPIGSLAPRIMSMGDIHSALPDALSSAPERASTSMVLNNQDGTLTKYIIGTTGAASTEYSGDGFINLRGKIYIGFIDSSGVAVESAITPTMFCSGSISADEHVVNISLSTRDDSIVGDITKNITVRMVKNAAESGTPDRQAYYMDGTAATFTATNLTEYLFDIIEALDDTVPWAYGTTPLPLIITQAPSGFAAWGLLFVSQYEPYLADAGKWIAHADTSDRMLGIYRGLNSSLWSAKLTVTLEDATTTDIYICGCKLILNESQEYSTAILMPPPTNGLGARGTGLTAPYPPTELARAIVRDLSTVGISGCDATSFDRAKYSMLETGLAGGSITGGARISEILQHIGEPMGVAWWIGLDDKLHAAIPGYFSATEKTLAAGTLPSFGEQDVLGDWDESVPIDGGSRGSAVSRLILEWSSEQEKFWTRSKLFSRAPGNALLPLGDSREFSISGAWLNPDMAEYALAEYSSLLTYPTRRIRFRTHDWVASYEHGSMFRLTYSQYTNRLIRLEGWELNTENDTALCTFEDLGPVESQNPCVYDSVVNWVHYNSVGSGVTLELYYAADSLKARASTGIFTAGMVGSHIHTPGATNATSRKISRRIASYVDAQTVTVDYAFGVNEIIPAVAGGTAVLDAGWIILYSQDTKANTTKLTACNETSGFFRDGTTAGFNIAAG